VGALIKVGRWELLLKWGGDAEQIINGFTLTTFFKTSIPAFIFLPHHIEGRGDALVPACVDSLICIDY